MINNSVQFKFNSIGTTMDNLGWPWTATNPNFRRISPSHPRQTTARAGRKRAHHAIH